MCDLGWFFLIPEPQCGCSVVTSAELKQLTVKELSEIARHWGIVGWHDMRKDDLVRSLVARSRSKLAQQSKMPPEKLAKKLRNLKPSPKSPSKPTLAKRPTETLGTSSTAKPDKIVSRETRNEAATSKTRKESAKSTRQTSQPRTESVRRPDPPGAGAAPESKKGSRADIAQGIRQLKEKFSQHQRIRTVDDSPGREDRLVLLVRDPYWIQAYWAIGSRAVDRARVALAHHWHSARPVLRLFRIVSDGAGNPRQQHLRDIPIHGGVDNWYIDVTEPPAKFRVEIGYIHQVKQFYSLAASNTVVTPQSHIADDGSTIDGNWSGVAADFDRVFKLSGGLDSHNSALKEVFEEKLKRPMSVPLISRFGPRSQGHEKTKRNFDFQIDADIVLYGQTDPSVQISIKGEPIRLGADGSFSVRFSLPEKRHVFPIDASGSDGVETQRVILAVERNTKILETLIVEHDEDE